MFRNKISLIINNVKIDNSYNFKGIVNISVKGRGQLYIGKNLRVNSGKYYNRVGRPQNTTFIVNDNAKLIIGNNVKMSSTVIVCHKSVTIKENVGIGANTIIYDTDFHNVDPVVRTLGGDDPNSVVKRPVIIDENVFIGGHCIILKGVHIGKNSIIGAGSVVTRNIPENQIWAGNPAIYIKDIINNE